MDDNNSDHNSSDSDSRQEQEEALVALIEHRTREVKHLKQRISYYQSQVASFVFHEHVLLSLIDFLNLKFWFCFSRMIFGFYVIVCLLMRSALYAVML